MSREDSGGVRGIEVVLVAVGLGLLIGLGEVAALGWRYFVRDAITHVSPHVVWMAPLGYATLFLVLTPLALGLNAAARPDRSNGLAPIVAICLSIGLVGWIIMLPWAIHVAAALILAIGAAWRLAGLADRHASFVAGSARRLVPALGVITAIGAATVTLRGASAERSAYSQLGPAADGAPNVLLLVLDTVRAKSLGLYGGRADVSPNIDALASSSVVFGNALATAPWTLPSHASMFTGRWPHETSVGWSSPLDKVDETLAEALSDRGYATAGFVANLSYASWPYGLHRGFARYEDFPVNAGQIVLSTSIGRAVSTMEWLRSFLNRHELLNRKTAGRINRDFFAWLNDRPERPFFAFLNYFDAHEPYEPPSRVREAVAPGYRRTDMGHRHNLLRGVNSRRLRKAEMPAEDVPRELALYEGAIQALDAEIGSLLRRLDAEGILDRTILILTSDHGEHVGEHGIFEHGQTLYEAAIRVPFVVRLPGADAGGRRFDRPVSIRDIPATVLDLVSGEGEAFPGFSLSPIWNEDPEVSASAIVSPAVAELHRGTVEQPWYPIAAGLDMQAMMSGSLWYICNPDASEELYDLADDPAEANNLAGTPHGDQAVHAFRAAIAPVGAPPRWCPPPANQDPKRPERTR